MNGEPPAGNEKKEINGAPWGTRFGAWLIDILLVNAVINIVLNSLGLMSAIYIEGGGIFTFYMAYEPFNEVYFQLVFAIIFFIYWTILEGYQGQSLGKMALNLKVIHKNGEKIGFMSAAIESFGKAFILPLDIIIGWLVKGKDLRFFNKISNTTVIITKKDEIY